MINPSSFLSRALLADAVFSGVSAVGLTFGAGVLATFLNLPEALLRESAMSLVEVALTVGYSDQTAFTRAFKRWTSSTPRAYRRNGHGEGMASRYLFKGHMADPEGRWPD